MNPTVDALMDICRIVAAVCQARTLPPAELGAVVACLRDNNAGLLADALIGSLPFEARPTRAELERLTYE